MNCVQCYKEMTRYASFPAVQGEDGWMVSHEAYICESPKCPNFNLLQGKITPKKL